MKPIPVNLATEPIEAVRRARRVLAVAAVGIGLLTLAHVAALAWVFGSGNETAVDPGPAVPPAVLAEWQGEVTRLEAAADVLRARRAAAAVELGEQLVAWRSIPWGAIFGHLETLLPDRVRLESVQPAVDPVGDVRISMTAVADDTGPLQDLLIALEMSPRFRDVLPQREDVGSDGLLRLQLWAYYVPVPGPATDLPPGDLGGEGEAP